MKLARLSLYLYLHIVFTGAWHPTAMFICRCLLVRGIQPPFYLQVFTGAWQPTAMAAPPAQPRGSTLHVRDYSSLCGDYNV